MSRLITMLLLLRNGFSVGRYIPIEERILKDGELYYNALSASEKGWHEGEEDPEPFVRYLLGTILAAYKDLEERLPQAAQTQEL